MTVVLRPEQLGGDAKARKSKGSPSDLLSHGLPIDICFGPVGKQDTHKSEPEFTELKASLVGEHTL